MPKGDGLADRNRARARDITGLRCNSLTVIGPTDEYRGTSRLWLCQCDCGNTTKQPSYWLIHGKRKSCGCKTNQIISAARTRHGDTDCPTWKSWSSMLDRCYLKSHKSYTDYGGRGISVCDDWLTYENFRADMGERPSGKTLGRIDNNGPYCKENCEWQSYKTQARNRRNSHVISYNGASMSMADWADRMRLPYCTLQKRIENGWNISDALNRPAKQQRNSRAVAV